MGFAGAIFYFFDNERNAKEAVLYTASLLFKVPQVTDPAFPR
jgi:hypothetical protein